MTSNFRNLKTRTRLLLDEVLSSVRDGFSNDTDAALKPVEITQLEQRILMSASPMAVVADAPPESNIDDCSCPSQNPGIDAAETLSGETHPNSGYGTATDEGVHPTDISAIQVTVELVVIDPAADDWEQLVADIQSQTDRNFDVLVLDPHQDGIAQITDRLQELSDVSAIHLVSHGDEGEILLGTSVLSQKNIDRYAAELVTWQHSMTADADLLIYGCDLAASDSGLELTESLNVLLGTDVAASDDLTGHESQGGDWDLEVGVGVIETAVAFSPELQAGWTGILTLNAYEAFDYAAGSLDGQNGGTGFATAWSLDSGNSAIVNATGLTAPTGLPTEQGGTLEMNTGLGAFEQSRDLTATLGTDGTTAWFSFLMRPDNVSFGGISFEIGDGTGADNTVNIGNNGNDWLVGIDGSPAGVTIDNVVTSGQTYFMAVQIDFAAGNDTVTLYVDPTAGVSTPDSPPAMQAQLTTADLGTFSRIAVIGGFSGNAANIDEIRVGDTYADVAGAVVNQSPTADAGGAYSIAEGQDLVLDASGSSDPEDSLTYNWDLDGDGQFDDLTTTSATPTVSWASLPAAVNDDGVWNIAVEVSDGVNAAVASSTTSLTVTNTAPTLTTTGTGNVTAGSLYTLNLSAIDPGDDAITGWTINWGDGTISNISGNPSSVTHVYSTTQPGLTFNILASATDEDGTHFQNQLLVASSQNDRVMRYGADGSFLQEFAIGDGTDYPVDLIIGPDGNMYLSGWNSDDVRRYNPTTGAFIDAFVPAGTGGLDSAAGLAFGSDGNLYVASRLTSEVLRFNGTTGAFIDAFVTAGSGGLNEPEGLTFGPDGHLYVSDYRDNKIFKYDGTTGAFLTEFVSPGNGLSFAEDLEFGPDGNLYVADNNSVLRYDGTNGAFIDAFATGGGLDYASGIAFGPDGNLYVGSWGTDNVLRYDGTTGAFINEYITAGSGGLGETDYLNFIPEHQVTVAPLELQEVASGPVIDGTIDALWTSATELSLQNVNIGAVDNAADLSGHWKSVWDDNNLYFLVDVTDDTLVNDSGLATHDDLVEIYIDADNSKGSSYDGTNDFEYGFRYNDPGTVYIGANSVNDSTGVTFNLTAGGSGYILEVSVPWSTLGVTPVDAANIGIDVHVTDDDDGGNRDGKLAWNDDTDQAFQDPSTFGAASLNALPGGDQLNEQTTDQQIQADIAADPTGNYVVTWQSENQDGNGWEIYARRYAADGTALSSEFRVNQTLASDQTQPRIAMDSVGNFVVTWTGKGQDSDAATETNVYARVFDNTGAEISGGEFLVNNVEADNQVDPSVAMDDSTGDFVVAWSSFDTGNGDWDIYKRRFNVNGVAYENQVRVNSTIAGDQIRSDVGVSSWNEYTIVWTSYGQDGDSASEANIYVQNYKWNGALRGGEILANKDTTAGHQHSAAIAVEADGDYDIVWVSEGQDGDGAGIYADQIAFGASGNNNMGEYRVASTTAGEQTNPDVAVEPLGNLVFTWQSTGQDGDGPAETNIYGRLFDVSNSSITPMAGEFLINTTTTAVNQSLPAVAVDGDDDFIVAWSGNGNGDSEGVYAKIFTDQLTNLAPTIDLANSKPTFTEGNAPLVIDGGLSISDPDDTDLAGATVSFRDGFAGSEDVLSFTPLAGIVGNYDTVTGTLTFTGNATIADYQTILQSVTYENTAGTPDTTTREIEFFVNDGTATTSDVRSVLVVDVNLPPTVDAGQSFNTVDTATNGTSLGFVSATDGDVGTTFSSWTITGGNTDGIFAIDANSGELTVVDNTNLDANATSSYTLTITVSDGTNTSAVESVDITVTLPQIAPAVNDESYGLNEGGTLNETVVTGWYNPSWKSRQQITFDNSASGSNLINHAVRIQLHASDANSVNVDYTKIQDSGDDLRFVDGNGDLLNHEIESWDEAGFSYVWVEVPQIDAGSATDFVWMYYDHATVTDGQNAVNVWDANDVAIMHMDGDVTDSSQYNNNGGQSGVVIATGIIGGAGEWDGVNSFVQMPNDSSLDDIFNGGGTISAWINADTWGENDYGRIADKATTTFGGVGNGDGWAFQVATGGKLIFEHGFSGAEGGWETNNGTLTNGTWHHVAVVYDSSSDANDPLFYIDGVLQSTTETDTPSGTFRSDAGIQMTIGNHAQVTSRTFDGRIDELRVSTNTSTPDEIAANVAVVNGTFVTGSVVETGPGGVLQNDSDANGDNLTVTLVIGPVHASSFTLNADGSFDYTHNGSENFSDSFTYQVSDGTSVSGGTVTLNITPQNDNLPVIAPSQSFGVSETATNGTPVGTVAATDDDTGTTFSGWTITGGNADGIFAINSGTGQITVADNTNLDYESATNYNLTLTVSDGTNTSVAQTVTVNVGPENDELPVVTAGQSFSVADTVGNGTPVGTVTATDPDGVTVFSGWTITGGNTDGIFAINGTTGQITVVDNTNLDATATGSYTLQVRVSDGLNTSLTESVGITVTNGNPDPPTITAGQVFAVSETASNGTNVGTAVATDPQTGTTFSGWTITGGNADGIFGINGSTGQITVVNNTNLDYESTTTYALQLTVSDGTNTSVGQTVTVNINPENDELPVVTAGLSFSVADTVGNGTPVGTVTATDPDGATVFSGWTITGGDTDGIFAINGATGQITVVDNTNLDSFTTNSYALTVTVSDGVNTSVVEPVGITVTNGNPDPPTITAGQIFAVSETATNGTNVGTAVATDPQPGTTFSGWTITGGNADGIFGINASTGQITVTDNINLDYESTTSYALLLTVSDGLNTSAAQTVTVNINSENDNVPVITAGQTFNVSEAAADGTIVGTVAATDADSGTSFSNWNIVSGDTDDIFDVDNSGRIFVDDNSNLDFESATSYTLVIDVSDGDNTSLPQSVTVNVGPENDNSPVFTSSATPSIAEGIKNLHTLSATDADLPSQSIGFSIVGGDDAGLMTIQGGNRIRMNPAPNFEAPADANGDNVYEVIVRADDGSGRTTDQVISITITDLNDNDPVVDAAQTFSVREDAVNGAVVGTVTATDADAGTTFSDWTIVNGNNDGIFSLNSATGLLTIVDDTNLDHESQSTYSLRIRVSDGTNVSSQQNVLISIADVNEPPVISTINNLLVDEDTSVGPIAFNVGDVDNPAGTLTVTATSSDQNRIKDSEITLGGTGTNRFIAFQPVENANGGPTTITVTVSDGTSSASTTFNVGLRPVNDDPKFTGPNSFTFSLDSNSITINAPGLLTGACDVDGDPLFVVVLAGPANGTLAVGPGGGFTYEAVAGFSGTDTFTYLVTDGYDASPDRQIILQVPVIVPVSNSVTVSSPTEDAAEESAVAVESEEPTVQVEATTLSPVEFRLQTDNDDDFAPPPAAPIQEHDSHEFLFSVKTDAGAETFTFQSQTAISIAAAERVEYSDLQSIEQQLLVATGSHGLTNEFSSASKLTMAFGFERYPELKRTIDQVVEFEENMESQFAFSEITTKSIAFASTSIVIGTVVSAIRGGMLALGLLSQLPVWTLFDPMMVMDGVNGDEGESLEDIVEEQAKKTQMKNGK